MRSRISWLVIVTTSTVVVSFVIPLCLLVRTLAEDRATAAADQEARNVAILVASLAGDPQLPDLVRDLDGRAVGPRTSVLTTSDGQVLGSGAVGADALAADPEVQRALTRGEAFTVTDGDGARVLIPVVVEDGTDVVRTEVPREVMRRGVWPAWLGIIGLGVVLMLLALGDRTAPEPTDQRAAARGRRPSRTGCARATSRPARRSGAPARPRSWPGR